MLITDLWSIPSYLATIMVEFRLNVWSYNHRVCMKCPAVIPEVWSVWSAERWQQVAMWSVHPEKQHSAPIYTLEGGGVRPRRITKWRSGRRRASLGLVVGADRRLTV